LAVVLGAVILLAVPVVLFVLPIPHGFAMHLSGGLFTPDVETMAFPGGSTVSGSWTNTGTSEGILLIQAQSGTIIYESSLRETLQGSGSFSFTANGSNYNFSATGTLTIDGSWSAPLL
jgi:hypothetical protein